jgi:hypothetical protein
MRAVPAQAETHFIRTRLRQCRIVGDAAAVQHIIKLLAESGTTWNAAALT